MVTYIAEWPEGNLRVLKDVRHEGLEGLTQTRDYMVYTSGRNIKEAKENLLKTIKLRELTPDEEERYFGEENK